MPKRRADIKKIEVREVSFGLYDGFDQQAGTLPKHMQTTTSVPAIVGQEFGYVLKIKGARGALIEFEIDHPGALDDAGQLRPPFTGEQYVRASDYDFFLGDGLWEPLRDLVGPWVLTTWLDQQQIARRIFSVQATEVQWDDLDSQ